MRSAPPADAQPGRGPLLQDLAAETEESGRAAAGCGRGISSRLDQGTGLDQAAEILLVQMAAGDCLDGGLQLGEGELARHQLEDHRPVFELRAQPRDRGRKNAAVVESHRLAERRQVSALKRGKLPTLGEPMRYDHRRILATAIARLRAKLKYRPVIFELMAPEFTLTELQRTAEAISGRHLHKQNFRRLVETAALVEPTGDMSTATGGRPAALFRFRREVLQERPAPGLRLGGRG